ncbi:MAG: hypothetical protein ACRDL5_14825 [Solirubrobacteraceae bacterium]
MTPPPLERESLLAAAHVLGRADAALVSLWCAHGLADEQIAAMSGVSAERLSSRRERIAPRLATLDALDLDRVRDSLAALAQPPPAVEPASEATPEAAAQQSTHVGADPGSAALAEPASPQRRRRRHRRVLGGAIAALCVALGVTVLATQRADAAPSSGLALSAGALRAFPAAPARPHTASPPAARRQPDRERAPDPRAGARDECGPAFDLNPRAGQRPASAARAA